MAGDKVLALLKGHFRSGESLDLALFLASGTSYRHLKMGVKEQTSQFGLMTIPAGNL